jgi:tetratricopeptide (TPR) repeat protein
MAIVVPKSLSQGVLLAVLSVALVAGCWDARFSTYDDLSHITENPRMTAPLFDLLKVVPESTYFPVTMLSYRLDQAMFAGWMPGVLGSWAPGVRFMTLLYHVAAALILWRLLLRLRLRDGVAFFIALVFAVHPLACETVCWASERKNALAGMFGFAALWMYLAGAGRWWRVPGTLAFYVLALASKPSALGLLPVFVLLELFGGAEGLAGTGPMRWKPCRAWVGLAALALPLAAAAGLDLAANLAGHAGGLVAMPGWSLGTAVLTDVEILARYLFNLLLPVHLSAAYLVQPIYSLSDARLLAYGLILLAAVTVTIALAANRRRAVFGWLWFVAALGPNLNLLAIPQLMQDRYLYLSTPGALLVLAEVADGLVARMAVLRLSREQWQRALSVAGGAYVVLLTALSYGRSEVWSSPLALFEDAVQRQPHAAYAHYGLGSAYGHFWENGRGQPGVTPDMLEEAHTRALQEWRTALDRCPDVWRYTIYLYMALNVAEDCDRRGERQDAERYWAIAAHAPRGIRDDPDVRAAAMSALAIRRLQEGRAEDAYRYADEAVAATDKAPPRLVRARAAVVLAKLRRESGDQTAALLLADQARQDASSVPAGTILYQQARALLDDPVLKN